MNIILSIIAVLIAWVFAIIFADTHRLVTREYTLSTDKLKEDITICLISDLHESEIGLENENLVRAIEASHPDIVLSAGDLITAHRAGPQIRTDIALSLMRKLSARYPVIAAYGNHEQKVARDTDVYGDLAASFDRAMEEAGVTLLRDDWEKDVCDGLDVAGLEVGLDYIRKKRPGIISVEEIREKIGNPDPARFTVLIAHDPAQFPSYAAWGADLTVSGHVHGGIIRLPFIGGVVAPPFQLFPHYDGGIFERNDGSRSYHMIISCGLGEHTIRVRFNNPRELVVIRLKAVPEAL